MGQIPHKMITIGSIIWVVALFGGMLFVNFIRYPLCIDAFVERVYPNTLRILIPYEDMQFFEKKRTIIVLTNERKDTLLYDPTKCDNSTLISKNKNKYFKISVFSSKNNDTHSNKVRCTNQKLKIVVSNKTIKEMIF